MKKIFITLLLLAASAQAASIKSARFPQKTIISTSGVANITTDYWQDFEFSGTVDGTALNGSDHGSSNTNTVLDSSVVLSTTTGASMPMISTVNTTTDSGTRGLNMLCTAGAVASVTVPNASSANFTISFFYHTSTPAAFDAGPRILRLQNTIAGELDLIYLVDENDGGGGNRQLKLRTNLGVNTIINCANATTYFITINWIKNSASSSITVKTASGSVVSTQNFTADNFNIDQFVYGSVTTYTGQSGINVYFDNILVRNSGTSSTDLGP